MASVRRSARSETEPKHRATKLPEGNVLFMEGKGRKGNEGIGNWKGRGEERNKKGRGKGKDKKGRGEEKEQERKQGRKGRRKENGRKDNEWKPKERERKGMGEGWKGRKGNLMK